MLGNMLKNILKVNKSFLPQVSSSGEEYDIQAVLEICNSIPQNKICFYPSSNCDLTDLQYVNGLKLPFGEALFPDVFIHSDRALYLDEPQLFRSIRDRLSYPVFSLEKTITIRISCKVIKLTCVNRRGTNNVFWLFQFAGFTNEEILKQLVTSNVKIDILYATCDGVTRGMGIGQLSIPTSLFWLCAPELTIRFAITDESINYFKSPLNYSKYDHWEIAIRNFKPAKKIYLKNLSDYFENVNEIDLASRSDLSLPFYRFQYFIDYRDAYKKIV